MVAEAPRAELPRRLALAGGSTVLAVLLAWWIWGLWFHSDSPALEESWAEHVDAYGSMKPGGTYEIVAFPATKKLSEVPTFTVHMNSRFVREREFEDVAGPGVVRIVAVGDSTTFGAGVAEGERFTEVLQAALEARRPGCCEVLNAGVVGMTAADVATWVEETVLTWSPHVIIATAGTNDIRDPDRPFEEDDQSASVARFEAGIRRLAATCRGAGMPLILWANANGDPRMEMLRPIRDSMARMGAEAAVPVIDIGDLFAANPATAEEQEWFTTHSPWLEFNKIPIWQWGIPPERAALQVDWVHPNRFGHKRLADALLPHVERTLDELAER